MFDGAVAYWDGSLLHRLEARAYFLACIVWDIVQAGSVEVNDEFNAEEIRLKADLTIEEMGLAVFWLRKHVGPNGRPFLTIFVTEEEP